MQRFKAAGTVKLPLCLIKYHAVKGYGGECSASHSIDRIGGWVRTRAELGAIEERKALLLPKIKLRSSIP